MVAASSFVKRPDLFAAALLNVALLDLLSFHKFTVGWAWKSEYGDPDNPEENKILLRYSPYHNLKKGRLYPSALITTYSSDDRVVPMHSYKFTAKLQDYQKGNHPTLLRLYKDGGHSGGHSASKLIHEQAEKLYFLERELNGCSFSD